MEQKKKKKIKGWQNFFVKIKENWLRLKWNQLRHLTLFDEIKKFKLKKTQKKKKKQTKDKENSINNLHGCAWN